MNSNETFHIGSLIVELLCDKRFLKYLGAKAQNYLPNLVTTTLTHPLECRLKALICDAPARAYVTGIKGHTGFYGCGKCTVKGKYYEHRFVFLQTNCELRSDHSFRSKLQEKHHNTTTVIERLPIDLVRDIPYEFMHLVCLGITKKLLLLWTSGKRKS
jgi:hypothetical protein